MRCKAGDLAMCIGKSGRNSGKMVTCLHLEDPPFEMQDPGPVWRIDRNLTWAFSNGGGSVEAPYAEDCRLIPIRPDPDEDDLEHTQEIESEWFTKA
jgi:hypothetical protein